MIPGCQSFTNPLAVVGSLLIGGPAGNKQVLHVDHCGQAHILVGGDFGETMEIGAQGP